MQDDRHDLARQAREALVLKGALEARRAGGDADLGADLARAALKAGDGGWLLQTAATLLAACGAHGEAIDILALAIERFPGLPGIAQQMGEAHQALGRHDKALKWMRRAVRDEPLAAGAYHHLLALELQVGAVDRADEVMAAMAALGLEADGVARGRLLWRTGQAAQAAQAFRSAYQTGHRERPFLKDCLGLLTGEGHYAEVLAMAQALIAESESHDGRWLRAMSGHAKLALLTPREASAAAAQSREASPQWLAPEALLDTIKRAIAVGQPFSFVRLGDGEARFLIALLDDLRPGLTEAEAAAIGDVIWENWFGRPMSAYPSAALVGVLAQLTDAVRTADIIGVTDGLRLFGDTGHYGYMVALERWVGSLEPPPSVRFTDAFAHHHLERLSPFLDLLLADVHLLGVISPHPDLAARLARRHGVARVVSHVLPGEGRLPTHHLARQREPAFPDAHARIMEDLGRLEPGAVYLVAAGLLGKIYCGEIKARGGVALDIGSIVDAWMGFNTRPGQLDNVGVLP